MIQIINGTYGRTVGGRIVPTTHKDGPFELSPEKEERLIKRGVAKRIGIVAGMQNIEADDAISIRKKELDEITRKNLDKIASDLGIENPEKLNKKADVIQAIIDAENEEIDKGIVNDDELPPSFTAEDLE